MERKYRYIRTEYEICLDVVSSPLDYGYFAVSYCPFDCQGSNFNPTNARPHIIDVSTGGTHILRFPYSNVMEAYDTTVGESVSSDITEFPINYFINGLYGTLAQAFSSRVRVRGRLVNPIVWGAINASFQLQSEMIPAGGTGYAMSAAGGSIVGSLVTAYTAGSAAFGAMKSANGVASEVKKASEWASGLRSQFADSEDQGEESSSTVGVQTLPAPYGAITDLRYAACENLSVTIGRLASRGLSDWSSHRLREIAQIPCITRRSYNFVPGGSATIRCAPYSQYNFADVNDAAPDYLVFVADLFRYWRGSIDYDLLFFTSPLITANFLIGAQTLGASNYLTVPAITGSTSNFIYKKSVKVTGFTHVKVKVPYSFPAAWCPVGGYIETSLEDNWAPFTPAHLTILCQNMSSGLAGSGAVPHCFLVVLRSGGEDIQFRNICGSGIKNTATTSPDPVVDPLFELQAVEVMKKGSGYDNIMKGATPHMYRYVPEDDFTIEGLCHRWSKGSVTINGELVPSEPYLWTNWYEDRHDLFDYLRGIFRYTRGCVHYKIRWRQPDPTADPSATRQVGMVPDRGFATDFDRNFDYLSMGASIIEPNLNPVMEFQAPMESYTEWVRTGSTIQDITRYPPTPLAYQYDSDTTEIVNVYNRAGRAFQLAYLLPPMDNWLYLIHGSG